MTAQEVIKKFMARLANHGFNCVDDPGTHMLDAAIRNCSRFHSTQEVLDAMHADQLAAEREAVEEVLGSEYAGQLLSDLDENILAEKSSAIKLRKAYIFLEKYCGIQLGKNFLFTSDGNLVIFNISGSETNTDTGAITGADANITLKAGDTDFYGTPLDLNALAESYGRTLEEDGSLIIGTGTFKDGHTIVEETRVNTYSATDSAQVINTGTRNWVVRAGDLDDTISAGGSDSINAGAGDDSIQVNAGGSTVTGGAGNDSINLSADVLDLTVTDFTSDDTLTIQGVFEIGAAKIEDMLLVITDKTGKRKLKFGDFSAALDGTVNAGGTSATLGQRLSDSGINLADLTEENNQTYYAEWLGAKLAPDDDYQPTPPPSTSTTPARLEVKEQATENYFLGTTATTAVNLDDFTGLSDGDPVTADGEVLGTVSSSFPATDTFTRNGLTIHLLGTRANDSITPQTFDELTDAQKTIVAGLFKWWAADCLTLDEDSLGISFNSDSAMINDIGLYFYTDTNTEVLAAVSNAQRTVADGCPTRLTLSVNMKYYDSIDPDDLDGDGKYNGHSGGYFDRTLAHEFVHALMGANVNFTNTLPQFLTEGVAELVHGIDDERSSTIFRLAYDTDALTAALDLTPGTGTADAYSGGYMFLRYFAKQAALQTLLLPAFGDITAQIDLANFQIGDSLYSDDAGNVSTVAGGIFLGNVVDDIEVGGTGGDAIYLVNDCGVNQIIHTAANDFQVGQLNANVTCLGSDADDYFQIDEGACSICAGTGNDYIVSTGQYATINTGDGSDTVRLGEGGHNLVLLGEGNNYVRMDGKPQKNGSYAVARNFANTITGGSDSDTLNNSSVAAIDEFGNAYLANEVFQGDDGKFFVHGYLDSLGTFVDDDISVTAVHFYQFNYDQLIDLGDGDNLINLSYLTTGSILTGGGLDQIIVEHADNSTLDAGAAGDLISLGGGSNNFLTGGAGADIVVISNYASDSNTITTGNDADYVLFGSLNDSLQPAAFIAHDGNLIDLGAGNDSLDFAGSNNTISGGKGDDFIRQISGSAGGNIFLCADTLGNDTISGFMPNDTIHIADTFSLTDNILTVLRGRDIKGTITFADAEDLTQLKIVTSSDGFIANGDAWDFYSGGVRQFILSGAANVDGVEVTGNVVKLSAANLCAADVSLSGDYSLACDDLPAPSTVKATYADGIYTTAGKTAGYTLDDKTITYSDATTKIFEFSGVDDDTTEKNFYVKGKTITIGKEAVKTDGTPVKILTDGYTLKLGKGMSAPATVKATYSDGIYTTAGKTDGYTLDDKSITYSDATTKIFEFSGVDDDTTEKNFYVKGKTITIGKEAVKTDGTPIKLLTDGYTLKLGKGMSAPATVKANYADGIYTTAGKTDGYTLDDKTITYTDATTKIFEFSGVDDDTTEKNFYVKGKTITIGKAAVKTDGTPVKLLTDGYTLKLGRGMSAPATVKANYADGIYTTAGKSAGYTLDDKSITYTDATTKIFEFSGLDDDTTEKNFYVRGKTITIGKDAVREDGTPVKLLTDGYTLKLGMGMAEGYTLSDDGKSIACTASCPSNLWGGFGSDLDLYQPSEEFVADDLLPILSVDSTFSPLNDTALKADDFTLALHGDDTFKVNDGKFKS